MPAADYYDYYQSSMQDASQYGSGLRVFRGGPQSGAGIGDFFRKVFHFIVPAVKSFASNTIQNVSTGMPLASAAKAAIKPTLSEVAAPLVSCFINNVAPVAVNGGTAAEGQTGSGSRKNQYKRTRGGAGKTCGGAKKRKTNSSTELVYNF